jgi:hypothetical protein
MKGNYIIKKDVEAKAYSTKFTRDIYVLKTKIAHIEDKIRITEIDKQKLKKLEKEKIEKIEDEKRSVENDIDKAINEINKKKEKIFNIQKANLDNFKQEFGKLTSAYEESVKKANEKTNEENEKNSKKQELKNEADNIKKMYDEAKEEINKLKEEANDKVKQRDQIKNDFPKEYEYFQEKIKYFRKIEELKQENKRIDKEKRELEKNIENDSQIKKEKNVAERKFVIEKNRNEDKIEELKSGIALEQLENDLKKHNSDIFSWSYIKEIMIQYYGEKYYDETTKDYIDNLRDIWTNRINYIFNEEYLRTKRAKESKLETIMNRLSELESNNRAETEEAKQLTEESENLKEEINIDENDFNKVYSIFNDVILLLNQIDDQNEDKIFSEHFIEQIININPEYNNMKEYARNNFDRLINLYINELIEHSKSKKNLIMRNKKCNEFIEEKNNENKILENQIDENNTRLEELIEKRKENLKEIGKIQNIIEVKTTEMKKYLNEICEEKFKNYKEENAETLKNFNKIYGKKILTKANKVQKEKIYEDRINEHIKMKDLMENISNYIKQFQIKSKELNEKIISLANKYQETMDQVTEMELNEEEEKEKGKKEEEIRANLKKEMDKKFEEQKIKLKNQKAKLEKQENIEYYIDILKKKNVQLKNISKKKEKVFEQFSIFFQQVQEEQLKLQEQSHQLKLQLLEFKSLEDENAFSSKVKMPNQEETNINEEEKNNSQDEEYFKQREERLSQLKLNNKLEIPETEDIFGLESGENTAEVEVYDIDMFHQNVKPLFEGVNVYKRFSEKAVKTEYEEYDPIKNRGVLPEAFDYALRKLYANINEGQFEFFTIEGIPKKEAVLPFEQIVGIRHSDNAKKIIKMKQEKPQTGTKFDFIGKDHIPFSIMTKNNNWDIVCPEYATYLAIKTMIEYILSLPKKKNKLDINQNNEEENIVYEEE